MMIRSIQLLFAVACLLPCQANAGVKKAWVLFEEKPGHYVWKDLDRSELGLGVGPGKYLIDCDEEETLVIVVSVKGKPLARYYEYDAKGMHGAKGTEFRFSPETSDREGALVGGDHYRVSLVAARYRSAFVNKRIYIEVESAALNGFVVK